MDNSTVRKLKSQAFPESERERIKGLEESNKKYEEFFDNERKQWGKKLEPLFNGLHNTSFVSNNSKIIIDNQAQSLRLRSEINDEISKNAQKLSNLRVRIKMLTQEKILFYTTSFPLKSGVSEKKSLIDAHIAENERQAQLFETHIEFLRECLSNLESYQYAIKNIISLLDFLGR